MHVDKTLTPGRDHYRTRQVGGSHQETQARMIRNYILSRPAPAAIIGGQRMKGQQPRKREALPPLSVPLPHIQEQTGSSDFEDIRMALAPNFIQFCKSPGAEVRRVTWNDLDAAAGPIHQPAYLPDLMEEDYRALLQGEKTAAHWKSVFPEEAHDFIQH
ncbi:reverse transcriptase, partial [Pyrenophora tritici-repentis]